MDDGRRMKEKRKKEKAQDGGKFTVI